MSKQIVDSSRNSKDRRTRLAALAAQRNATFLTEIFRFLRYNKKWWLAPLVMMLLLLGALIALGGTAVAPFIYTLF